MQTNNMYYQEEKSYTGNRVILLILLTFFSFALVQQSSGSVAFNMLYVGLTVSIHTAVAILLYLMLLKLPNTLVFFRKNLLIFSDLAVLTFLIIVFEKNGLFLLPLYIIIVMQSGLKLGISFFYTSVVSAAISWGVLLNYSDYWFAHLDIIATFAMTTFIIPLFYLKHIIAIYNKNDQLTEELTVVEYDAYNDALTGIPNRKTYKEVMAKAIKQREFFALLFIDLNKFKAINDTHGHNVGDEVLKEVSSRLQGILTDDDFLARLGGDEFVIVTRRKKAFLRKFLIEIEKASIGRHTIDDVTVRIELSIGVSMCPDDSKSELMLSKYADDAMYIAKKRTDTYHVFYEDVKEEL